MRLVASLLLFTSLLGGCASQQREAGVPAADNSASHTHVSDVVGPTASLEQMLEQDNFDLPRALLLFSEKYYPDFSGTRHDVDVNAKLARFNEYARQLRVELHRDRSPRQRVRTLVDFVHIKLGLRFDQADARGENPENLFFDRVLQRRFGYCVTLSLAYIVFGQAAGLDVAGMRIPGHFVVQFQDVESNGHPYKVILESTAFGDTRDETWYWAEHRFSAVAVENGVYLKPLTDREIFGTLYNNLAGVTYVRGNTLLAVERYNRALELAPNNAESLYNRAVLQHTLGKDREALKDLNEALRLEPNFVLAMVARAGLLWEAGEREPARSDLANAKRLRKDWPQPWMLEGMFAYESGQLDDARAAFSKALQVDPKYNSAHMALAELERRAGNLEEARKHEEAAGMKH